MTNEKIEAEIQKDITPVMDLFTGADGGAGFVNFRHAFLPDVYKLNTPEAIEFKRMMKRMAAISLTMVK